MTNLLRNACVGFSTCACFLLASTGAWAQKAEAGTSSNSPVAIVYVSHPSSKSSGAPNNIVAWWANAQGKLTPVAGSPFAGNVIPMALNGKYLFGGSLDGSHIYSFSIASTGALKQVASLDDLSYLSGTCDQVMDLTLDHTGATLYSYAGWFGPGCASDATWQSFNIDKSNGSLSYLGNAGHNDMWGFPLSFIGNNVYAFEASGDDIYGFRRESNGMLAYATDTTYRPAGPNGETYNAQDAAADPTNHLAVLMEPNGSGDTQVGTYTASSTGSLSTTSNANNMPKSAVGAPYYSQMAPSGKLVAVAGQSGLQVFHYNGSAPATRYTGLLTTGYPVNQMYWDNDNHLYAISNLANKLYVFTITPTSYAEAPGSPYSIADPQGIIVLPKTKKP